MTRTCRTLGKTRRRTVDVCCNLVSLLVPVILNLASSIASIVSSPQSVNIARGDNATFNCTANAEYINWKVNDSSIDSNLTKRGFKSQTLVNVNDSKHLRMKSLVVSGSPGNNNTRIVCVAVNETSSGEFSVDQSEPALLIVQDPIGPINPNSVPIDETGSEEHSTHSELVSSTTGSTFSTGSSSSVTSTSVSTSETSVLPTPTPLADSRRNAVGIAIGVIVCLILLVRVVLPILSLFACICYRKKQVAPPNSRQEQNGVEAIGLEQPNRIANNPKHQVPLPIELPEASQSPKLSPSSSEAQDDQQSAQPCDSNDKDDKQRKLT